MHLVDVPNATHYGRVLLSLRDYFAGQALAGMLAAPRENFDITWLKTMTPAECASKAAYQIADAMLAAREKNEKGKT
jgi:hypothetical protein